MQSISCEMPGWMNHKVESRLQGEISTTSDMQISLMAESKEELFNSYAEYIMRNGLEEAQTGIKIAGRNLNNLRYADDTTLMAESEEELKSLLMKVKVESEKVGLKLNSEN